MSPKKYSKLGSTFNLIHAHKRADRSHGHKTYHNKSFHENVTLDYLYELYNGESGLHLVRSTLFLLPWKYLSDLNQDALEVYLRKKVSREFYYTITGIAYNRLYKPVLSNTSENPRRFMKIFHRDKGIDFINIANILHNKKVQKSIPDYFEDRSCPIISYKYPKPIGPTIFNHTKVTSNFRLQDYL